MCVALMKLFVMGVLFLIVGRAFQLINTGRQLKKPIVVKDGSLVINTSKLDVSQPLIIVGEVIMIISSVFLVMNCYDLYQQDDDQFTIGN